MNLNSLVREARLLALAGAVAFAVGIGLSHTGRTDVSKTTAGSDVRIADSGSESTGKPPGKPHRSALSAGATQLIADGSESTGKPPTKPKG